MRDEHQEGYVLFHTFPHHIIFMLPSYFDDMNIFFHGKHLQFTLWSKQWMSCVNSFHVRAVLSHECGVDGVHINSSIISHSHTGMGCCAA